jgi:hypothetical protein
MFKNGSNPQDIIICMQILQNLEILKNQKHFWSQAFHIKDNHHLQQHQQNSTGNTSVVDLKYRHYELTTTYNITWR